MGTVISWCTYPIVFILPMISGSEGGKSGLSASSMVMVQVGYTASDIISKCGVGYLVYRIGLAKSSMEKGDSPAYEPKEVENLSSQVVCKLASPKSLHTISEVGVQAGIPSSTV